MASSSSSVGSNNEGSQEPQQKQHVLATEKELDRKYEVEADAEQLDNAVTVLKYNRNDQKDMHRMGKKPQLRRSFRQLSMISLVLVMVDTWSCVLLANQQGLQNGGLAGLFWSYIWTMPGFAAIAASLAEMASIAPTSGGMYHWVSEFAPSKYQKILSYITGWMAVLSWQAGNASGAYIAGTTIGAMLTVANPNYAQTDWQALLFVFATVLVVFFVNVAGYRWLPMMQNVLLWIFGMIWVAFICIFWILSPKTTAHDVFLNFTNGGDWRTIGLSLMIGQITAIYGLVGSDTAAHLAEEMRDASLTVPKAIWYSFSINALLGLIMLITFLFTITDVNAALNDPTGYSYFWVMKQTLPESNSGIYAYSAVLLLLALMSNINFNMTTSRQFWAFSRDGGVPYGRFFAHVNGKLLLPVRSIALTCTITCLLALLNMGSNIAFNAIISLFLVALMFTYIVSIGCFLQYRLRKGEPKARWTLGRRLGITTNSFAIVYCMFSLFWCFWPATTATDPADFNWAIVIFGGVFILAIIFYYAGGRKLYKAPVCTVVSSYVEY